MRARQIANAVMQTSQRLPFWAVLNAFLEVYVPDYQYAGRCSTGTKEILNLNLTTIE